MSGVVTKRSIVVVAATLATTCAGLALASPASAATNANYSKGILTISGDNAANLIVVSRDNAGHLKVNNGAVKIRGGQATVSNTTRVQVFGSGGADTVSFDEGSGPLPAADVFGGADGDTIGGGSKADQLWGQSGDDLIIWGATGGNDLVEGGEGTDTVEARGDSTAETFAATANGTRVRLDRTAAAASFLDIGATERLLARAGGGDDTFTATGNLAALIQTTVNGEAGKDSLLGSNGADVLDGGDDDDFVDGQQGNDAVVLGAGDDAFAWDPGDGNDTVDGGAGSDSSRVNGSNANENMAVSANGAAARFTRDIAAIVTDLTRVEKLRIGTSGGTDNVTVNDVSGTGLTDVDLNLSAAIGGGDAAADTVTVTGTPGADSLELTSDGTARAVTGLPARVSVAGVESTNDRLALQGGDGQDTLALRGSAGDDLLDVVASNGAALFGVNGGVTTSTAIEGIVTRALGGADRVTVGDLTGSEVGGVQVELANDGQADLVTVNGTQTPDQITAAHAPGGVAVNGLAAAVTVVGADAGQDLLTIAGLAGDDVIDASAVSAGAIKSAINGGLGIDLIRGTQGDDAVTGGDGNDHVYLGGGDDVFSWSAGDDNDTVDGEAGVDSTRLNGTNIAENIAVTAVADHVRVTRDIATVSLDLHAVEHLGLVVAGGADNITVGGLSGTDLTDVEVGLNGPLGSPDGASDTITVLGTPGDDDITVSGTEPGTASVVGLATDVTLTGADGQQLDRLVLDAGAGDDYVDASGLTNQAVALTVFGGEGADFILGGDGNDTLDGGPHDDSVLGSDGDDVILGGDGDDVLIGGPGSDTLTGGNGDDIEIQD
jgi:Ca2+-binding RTX toxin-like protein